MDLREGLAGLGEDPLEGVERCGELPRGSLRGEEELRRRGVSRAGPSPRAWLSPSSARGLDGSRVKEGFRGAAREPVCLVLAVKEIYLGVCSQLGARAAGAG